MRHITATLILLTLVLFSSESFAAYTQPGVLSFSLITNTSFQVSWAASTGTPAPGPSKYYLDVCADAGYTIPAGPGTGIDLGNVLTVNVSGLSGNTTYYVRIRAWGDPPSTYSSYRNGNAATIPSIPLVGTIAANSPAVPVAAPYDTQFTAKWSAPVGGIAVTGYYLEVATDSGFSSMVAGYNPKTIAGIATVTSAVTSLTGGTQYFYRVRAYNASGTSGYSNWASIYTLPAAPGATAATGMNSSGFTANWNASPGATNYLLDVGTALNGTDVMNNSAVGNVTSFDVSGLLSGKNYYYRLRAVDPQGTNPTNSNNITVLTVPAAPAVTGRTTAAATSVTVTWTASTGAAGYYLDVALDSGFTDMVAGFSNLNLVGNVTTKLVTGLTAGTDYYYRVRAYNASGTSADSTTLLIDRTAPTVVGMTSGSVDLSLSTLGGPYVTTTTPLITVNFSEPVLGILYGTSIILKNSGGTALAGAPASYTPNPANQTTATAATSPSPATFQPTAALTNSMKYSITVTGGITATTIHDALSATVANNNTLVSPPFYYFTVDTTNPTVASVSPADGATGVDISPAITIVFTENCVMNNMTYNNSNIQLTDSGGNPVSIAISSPASPFKTLTITPSTSLFYNSTYTLTLRNIKDAAGNLLDGTGSYTSSFTTRMVSSSAYSMVPAFLSAPVIPNVLIILDNSNSMDETLVTGDAIGSFHCTDPNDINTCSRSVLARRALIDLINTYAGKINIGLMSYNLPAGTSSSYYLYNDYYFASYDPRTYCGINPPPTACYNYCVTESSTDEADCNSACQGADASFFDKGYTFNANFQANLREPIITNVANGSTVNSDKRKRYCGTIYPKTASIYNAANNVTIYHALPGTFYSGSNAQGTKFLYSGNPPVGGSAYNPSDTVNNSYLYHDNRAAAAAPPYDGYVGYSNSGSRTSFGPTDDDKALGFYNFGQAMMWYPPNNGAASKTWFANSAANPAGGFLHVPAAINLGDNVQLNKLLRKIGAGGFKNDEAGYMACDKFLDNAGVANVNGVAPNRCGHIVNAGVTPTAGTLQSAIDYLNGILPAAQTQNNAIPASPLQYSCQKTFIIYVTDGLASVDANGAAKDAGNNLYTAETLTNMSGGVIDKLKKLRCSSTPTASNCGVSKTIGGKDVKFDVMTYVLGLAISPQSSSLLDAMAVEGGTAKNGKAFYANDATSLNNALVDIFQNILSSLSGGTAASIVNNSGEAGTNMLQAVFYPEKEMGGKKVSWIGELQNMWFYLDPYLTANAIREDTVADKILDMNQDYKTTITFDTALGRTMANRFSFKGTFIDKISLDDMSPLWRAGELLYRRDLSATPRTLLTSINGTTLLGFTDANKSSIKPYLQAATDTEAAKIISWVHGVDDTSDATIRSRTVSYKGYSVSPWRLGDIISSTPKVQPSSPMQGYDLDYNDLSYKTFWMSNNYKIRGMVYSGANDGMLHAFKLGLISKVSDVNHPTQVAKITPDTAPPLGQEEWAYIPKNVLPYLRYLMQPDYSHLYTVDATTRLIDVSINAPTGCSGDYWDCPRKTTLDSASLDPDRKADLVYGDTSWRTLLIGSMGLGGATRTSTGACAVANDCVRTPITTLPDVGLSSYFALDVSEPVTPVSSSPSYGDVNMPTSPSLLWEFSVPTLGYTLSPPAIIRVNGKVGGAGVTQNNPDKSKNGRWFAVFGSGPTGPVNTSTHQFYGKSDQTLKLFVVDLKTGTLLRTIDTGVAKAFAGSLSSNSALDTDFWDASAPGNYSHDVVYIGYSFFDEVNARWDGGVFRLVTNESTDPANWTYSKVIDGVGPITTAVAPLQNRNDKQLWLYFGGGRYFYKDSSGIDDADADPADVTARRYIYGVKEPCYPKDPGMAAKNAFDPTCTSSVTAASLTDQSDNASSLLSSSATGWKIKLSASNSDLKSERLLTNPLASYNGNVTFTTFMPTADVCGYGGQTFVWVVRGMTGSAPPVSSLKGKLILQLSTGAFETVDLSSALTGRQGRRTGTGDTSNDAPVGGFSGSTSKDTPPEQKPPKGVPRILQIRER